MRRPWDEINFPCHYCEARPGEPCTRANGQRTRWHSDRIATANKVWKRIHPERVTHVVAADGC